MLKRQCVTRMIIFVDPNKHIQYNLGIRINLELCAVPRLSIEVQASRITGEASKVLDVLSSLDKRHNVRE